TFSVKDTHAETVTYTAKDTTDSSLILTHTVQVTFVAGAVDAGVSTVVASPSTGVMADGSATSTITVTLKDANGNLVTTGKTVKLTAGTGSSKISSVNGSTSGLPVNA